ncbi:MAG: peptidoglycan-binding protein [Actinophytocola sp.]|uniref:peptidoglycan-binding protein n=1 Tax=Actinophytocola sp. TaxID=1872138 RepID=UPI003C79037B
MTLPVLDKESYQYACSDWVLEAGRALQREGYLRSEPTGSYDEEFDTALRSFQSDRGIYEEDQVGPQTWTALGIEDPADGGYSEEPESSEMPVGQLSEDGQWQWDGTQWVPAESSQEPAQAPVLSEDGQWQWDGTQWIPAESSQPAAPAAPAAASAADPGLEVLAGGKRYIIFSDEVRSDGTISWRARNPGNIRSGEKYGAYPGKKANTKSAGSFAVFPDEQTGFEAIKAVLKGYGNITVVKAMNKYAPVGDGANDPDAYARKVAKDMGVSIETKVPDLDDDQMETFAEAIKKVEGWKEGTTYALDDPKLPAEVLKGIRGE